MRNVFLLPEKFESLSRDELIDAFFGYYYETVIALRDDKLIGDIIDYVKTSLKYQVRKIHTIFSFVTRKQTRTVREQ